MDSSFDLYHEVRMYPEEMLCSAAVKEPWLKAAVSVHVHGSLALGLQSKDIN